MSAANPGVYGQGPSWLHDDRTFALWSISRPLLIAGTILGFVFWWPLGIVLLCLAIWNRRLGRVLFSQGPAGPRAFGCAGWAGPWSGGRGRMGGFGGGAGRSSGNQAFDEYKAETLRRLEDEQAEFASFLDRLRFAKDKAEFDQFMAERRRPAAERPEGGDQPAA
ncbi:DUF2852 domain-containing protein [Acidisoma sp. 7E03]